MKKRQVGRPRVRGGPLRLPDAFVASTGRGILAAIVARVVLLNLIGDSDPFVRWTRLFSTLTLAVACVSDAGRLCVGCRPPLHSQFRSLIPDACPSAADA